MTAIIHNELTIVLQLLDKSLNNGIPIAGRGLLHDVGVGHNLRHIISATVYHLVRQVVDKLHMTVLVTVITNKGNAVLPTA